MVHGNSEPWIGSHQLRMLEVTEVALCCFFPLQRGQENFLSAEGLLRCNFIAIVYSEIQELQTPQKKLVTNLLIA